MKKFCTLLILSLILCAHTFAQTCSTPSTSNITQNITENFSAGNGGFEGVDGTWGYNTSNKRWESTATGIGSRRLNTHTLRLAQNTTTIVLRFKIEKVSNWPNVSLRVRYITASGSGTFNTTDLCWGTSGTALTTENVYQISISNVPMDMRNGALFRIQLDFNLTNANGTSANNQVNSTIRFYEFGTNAATSAIALPVTFIRFEGRKASGSNQLLWHVADERNVSHYEVERSGDGRNFRTVGMISAGGQNSYEFNDRTNLRTAYYRIRNVDQGGRFAYSQIVSLKEVGSQVVLNVFPVPAKSEVTLQYNTTGAGTSLFLATAHGQQVRQQQLPTGSQQTTISIADLTPGLYFLQVRHADGTVETAKLIKN